jgi:glucose-6-phosphate 3-dehydrogenase
MHMSAVTANPHTTIVGVYDVATGRAEEAARAFGCAAFDSWERLYAEADGIIIASPNDTHAQYALDALGHGKHVLCEKPMTTTLADARKLAHLASRCDVTAGVGFNYRYLAVARALRRILRSGDLGGVLFAELALMRSSALTRTAFTWRDSAQGRSTSGALGDLGVHLFDTLRFLFDAELDPSSWKIRLRTDVPEKEGQTVHVDDSAFVSGRLINGPHFHVVVSKTSLPEDRGLSLRLVGEKADFSYRSTDTTGTYRLRTRISWVEHALGAVQLDDPPGEVPGWTATFHAQLADWANTATGRASRSRLATFADGLRTQEVLDGLLRAAGLRTVRLPAAAHLYSSSCVSGEN